MVFYESGKLVVQGKGTQEFVEFLLEPEILGQARVGYETVLNPELLLPRLGVDESGKGDFFGPLCVAGVYINGDIVHAWREAGIKDSKNISSDKRIGELAKAEWAHVDFDRAEWFVPDANSKTGKGFTVPLAPAAMATGRRRPRAVRAAGTRAPHRSCPVAG